MRLVIFVGLQGAGKTTFYRRYFADGYYMVSKDLLRNSRDRQARQMAMLAQALRAGSNVVVDNTNPAVADRAPIISLGKEYGAAIIGFAFEAGVSECLRRNAGREGRSRVPAVAIYSTAKRLQYPTVAEGFDALFRVSIQPAGFRVIPERLPYDPRLLPVAVASDRIDSINRPA